MDRKTAIIAVLTIILVFSTATSYLVHQRQRRLIEAQADLIEQLSSGRTTGSADTVVPPKCIINSSDGATSAQANIVAVRSDTRSGVVGTVHVELKEGTGQVLVNTAPFIEPTTQYSIREAVEVAEDYTNTNISNIDIVISFDLNGTVIGGPSAGAASTVATIAALTGKQVKPDVAITGTIENDGSIGQVGGVFDKAVAAEKNGVKLLLVPRGQKKVIYYEQIVEEREIVGFSFTRVYYTPKEIDLDEYMAGKMAVVEVATIDEAVAYTIF